MISKKYRLSRSDFIAAKKHGKSYSTPHFSAVVYRNSASPSRFAVVLSTKFSKSAVVRNRLRRTIYDCLSTLHLELSTDLILYPKSSMLNLSRDQISSLLNSFVSALSSQA